MVAMLCSAAPTTRAVLATRFLSGAELGLKFILVTEHIRFCQLSPIQQVNSSG